MRRQTTPGKLNSTPERNKSEQGTYYNLPETNDDHSSPGRACKNTTPGRISPDLLQRGVLWTRPVSGKRHPRGPRGEMVPI